jgi:hypothetical protein
MIKTDPHRLPPGHKGSYAYVYPPSPGFRLRPEAMADKSTDKKSKGQS